MNPKEKTPEELLAEEKQINADLAAKIEELTALVSAPKTTEIAEKEAAKPSIPKATVKVDKKEYKWNVPQFKMPGSSATITAEEAATDKDLLKEILKIEGQGLLTEVV